MYFTLKENYLNNKNFSFQFLLSLVSLYFDITIRTQIRIIPFIRRF